MDDLPGASRAPNDVTALLARAGRVLGLRTCYHDAAQRPLLPLQWRQHSNPACLEVKARHQRECAAFCGVEVHQRLEALREGSIHTCPFGHTDIAVPVEFEGLLQGVVFAGVCWTRRSRPPRDGMVIRPGRRWLEDRRVVLRALARELAQCLSADRSPAAPSRRTRIVTFLTEHLGASVRLTDLAEHLSLSCSRTGHLVRECFGQTFPQLLMRLRLTRGARMLGFSDLPVSAIAAELGFADQSHFTRAFTRRYGQTPLQYRRTCRPEV